MVQMVVRQAKDLEVQISIQVLIFSWYQIVISQGTNYKFVFTYQFDLKLTDSVTDHNALHSIAFKREV